MSQEIEIKIRLSEEEENLLTSWLKVNSEFIKSVHHEEVYFSNPDNSFKFINEELNGLVDAADYLRVRKTEKGDSVCLKKFHKDPNRPRLYTHSDEYELNVSEGDTAIELFIQLGYTDETEITKDRDVYIANDFEIVIDKIKGLGTFAEVECKKEFKDPEEGIQEILGFLKSIGFKSANRQSRAYVCMLWNPDYDFNEAIEL